MRSVPTFDEWLATKLRDPLFRRGFQKELVAARVAVQIARLRQDGGISQRELARRMGTSQQGVARLERGAYDGMTLRTLERVADALGAELIVELKKRPLRRVGTR